MLEIVNLILREGGIACSYAFLGICEANFKGRDLFFIHIYTSRESNIFFYFDNLEPAPGRPAPELEVKTLKTVKLDVMEQAPGYPNYKII